MKGKSLAILILIVFVAALYVLWSSGKLSGYSQMKGSDVLPAMTNTDTTSDIEKDLDATTVDEEEDGYLDIEADLKAL